VLIPAHRISLAAIAPSTASVSMSSRHSRMKSGFLQAPWKGYRIVCGQGPGDQFHALAGMQWHMACPLDTYVV